MSAINETIKIYSSLNINPSDVDKSSASLRIYPENIFHIIVRKLLQDPECTYRNVEDLFYAYTWTLLPDNPSITSKLFQHATSQISKFIVPHPPLNNSNSLVRTIEDTLNCYSQSTLYQGSLTEGTIHYYTLIRFLDNNLDLFPTLLRLHAWTFDTFPLFLKKSCILFRAKIFNLEIGPFRYLKKDSLFRSSHLLSMICCFYQLRRLTISCDNSYESMRIISSFELPIISHSLSQLEYLKLDGGILEANDLTSLAALVRLVHLEVVNQWIDYDQGQNWNRIFGFTEKSLSVFDQLPQLTTLSLTDLLPSRDILFRNRTPAGRVNDAVLVIFAQKPKPAMRTLSLISFPLRDHDSSPLSLAAGYPNLETLYLRGSFSADSLLDSLSESSLRKTLKNIDIASIDFNEDGDEIFRLDNILRFKNLEILHLNQTRFHCDEMGKNATSYFYATYSLSLIQGLFDSIMNKQSQIKKIFIHLGTPTNLPLHPERALLNRSIEEWIKEHQGETFSIIEYVIPDAPQNHKQYETECKS